MFTGLVETIGVLRRRTGGAVARALIEANLGPLELGESISVNGACLTVDRIAPGGFECDMSPETLERTTLGRLPLGARVHLERATPLGGRMGGHVVLGHVDGIGRVSATERKGGALRVEVQAPAELARFIAIKGSIAIDGTSLTLNAAGLPRGPHLTFDVMLVPHTLGRTLLAELRPGAEVNLEVDVLARYVARQLEVVALQDSGAATHPGREGTVEHVDPDQRILQKLRSAGFA
ncbi:riboflavin synthase [Chondromyces apiculatus]|uniref:Riboflavin synthase n=1 Tax=Chondromyces apiculatus DSM 436 TaxID=1192034 RepID=A0A017TAN1_9BACT|nr:riboflavin synthase [Chondromyces apiculatus]EYF05885.1 Riboflavin synthase eubacterial/eukaryotic [Chondromyces apiculatus DSM 436]